MAKSSFCIVLVALVFSLVLFGGCQTEEAVSKVIAPVAKPVVDTTDDVFQKRTIESENGTGPKAVIFPDEPSDEVDEAGETGTKQFKLEF